MKMKLLLIAFFAIIGFSATAQTTANQVDDLTQCMNEVFDLTVQTAPILGDQPESQFTVTYHETELDAETGANVIPNPENYVMIAWPEQVIWARVTSAVDGTVALTYFVIIIEQGITIPQPEDVTVCGSYILPAIQWPALYYTEPNMGGSQIQAGTVISTTQTIYIHAVSGTCNAEHSFTVTVTGEGPVLQGPEPIAQCDENNDGIETYDLQAVIESYLDIEGVTTVTVYGNLADAENQTNPIVNPAAYTISAWLTQTVYIRVEFGDCVSIIPLQLMSYDCPTNNIISGYVRFDQNGNGCDEDDIPAANKAVYRTHNNQIQVAYTNVDGYYQFNNVQDGYSYVNMPQSSLYTLQDSGYGITVPTDSLVNFCLTAPTPNQDVMIYVWPLTNAVPGFQANYVVVISNVGNQTVSGSATVEYDATHLTYIPSTDFTQIGNTLSLNYSALVPFETRYYYFSAMVAQPPALNMGDILTFTGIVDPTAGDSNPYNNEYVLNQLVVNSYDPNDITVREGEFITEEQTGNYLHYMVRFQNTGNYQATNVRVEGELDANLDWDTFEPVGGSHEFYTLREGNGVKFMFDGINLPDSLSNEPASHGYVIYRIKPKATIQVNDTMAAQVGIFFDFNSPVITNTATTTVQSTATAATFTNDVFTVYPNPATGNVNIRLQNTGTATVTITDVLGKTVLTQQLNSTESTLDVSGLHAGIYMVTLNTSGAQSTKKLIINR